MCTRTGFGGIIDTSSSYFQGEQAQRYPQQIGYGSVPGWCRHWQCRYCHHIFMCHKHTSKQCKVTDRTGMEAYHGCAPGCICYCTKTAGILPSITGILIQQRPAQHMSCSPGQVLHLCRAHSPPSGNYTCNIMSFNLHYYVERFRLIIKDGHLPQERGKKT